MNLIIKKDHLNDTQHNVFLGNFHIGTIHGPSFKGTYSCYTTDDRTKLITYATYQECLDYIQNYIKDT